jgi:hypothetical protein
VGIYTGPWLAAIYRSFEGKPPATAPPGQKVDGTKLPIQIIFPTLRTVKKSMLGPEVGRRDDSQWYHVLL